MKYALAQEGVTREDGAFIPNDPANADWQAYQAWVAAGGKTAPIPGPSPDEVKGGILAELAALDLKKIRPIAEGDTAYLATLNAQTAALRAQLKGIK